MAARERRARLPPSGRKLVSHVALPDGLFCAYTLFPIVVVSVLPKRDCREGGRTIHSPAAIGIDRCAAKLLWADRT